MKNRLLAMLILGVMPAGFTSAADSDDGPGRGVARISVINGDVSVRRGDSGDWVAAAINAPLIVTDRLFVGPTSRGEVQFDYANMIRVGANSEIRLSELEYRRYQIQVARGTVTFRVLRDSDAEAELSTPNVSVRPLRKGIYRVRVTDDGTSEITVRSGEAEVFTPRGVERLRSGRTLLARGTASDPEYQIVAGIPEDEWDRWNEHRDRDLERSRSYRYVSRDIYGAEDLDSYGRWVYVPPHGWVWSPWVAAGWAPYRYGRWAWIDWYGWSWVSYDPWGWAPYHYGRWFHHDPYGWCWFPGSFHARHYWRPALVAFFGWSSWSGFHVGVGVGFGRVGWVPLAPYEPYYPWYGHGYYRGYRNTTYVDNSVRVVNNINITNVYRNARVGNAISAVDGNDFSRGRVADVVRVSDAEIRNASLVRGQLPVVPRQESLRLADGQARVTGAAERGSSDRFFSRREPRQPERVPFEEQRRGLEQVTRRTFEGERSRVATAENRPAPEQTRAGERTPSRTAEDSGRGWRRMDEPVRTQTGDQPSTGWRRFGEPVRSGIAEAPASPRVSERSAGERTESRQERSQDASGWRRFGEPSRTTRGLSEAPRQERVERSVERPGTDRGSDDGWRRFGTWREPASRETEPGLSRRPEPDLNRGRSVERDEPVRRQGAEPSERRESPRYEPRYDPRSDSPRYERREVERPVHVSPPIVRERESPRWEGSPRSGRVFDEPSRIERSPAPRQSSGFEGRGSSGQRVERSAPSVRGEGGGGRVSRGEARSGRPR